MITREVTADEVLAMTQREESHFFDKKSSMASGKKIEKIAVALANSDGGEFLVGVADDSDEPDPTKRWHGFDNIERLNSVLQVLSSLTPTLPFQCEFLKQVDFDGYVLRVIVEKGSEVHKTSDNTVYQRRGAQSLPVRDPAKIAELSFAKGANSYEDNLLNDLPPDPIVDSSEMASFLSDYSPQTDPLDFVVSQNLVDHKTWTPRIAAALLFHENPSAVVPKKCAVKITRYETREDSPERAHLAVQETIEGPSYFLIHETVRKVEEIMSSTKVWTPEGLKELDYPPEAIWETIVNSIIHRDYSISDDIQILIFDDRIEISSPGKLPGYVTVANILDSRYSRNPKLVRALNRYKEAPNKDLGEGLNTTFQKMKEWGLREPKITEVGNYVRVVLPHLPLASPSEAILTFLATHEMITNRQVRDLTGIRSENTVKNEFYKLRDTGLIEPVPGFKGAKAAWQLVLKD